MSLYWGFPGGSDGKESASSEGDPGLTPGEGRFLEKEMATHSSIFAWKIPWMEDPGVAESHMTEHLTYIDIHTHTSINV